MTSLRHLAIDLQQDITKTNSIDDVTKKLNGISTKDLEEIFSMKIDGRSLYQVIAANDRADILRYLMKNGVNISKISEGEEMGLHVAVSQNATKIAKLLLALGANVAIAGEDGKTPLHIASEFGNRDLVKFILESGGKALVNTIEASGCTPLSLACMTGNIDTVMLLIQNGAQIEIKRGMPPLHAASLNGNINVVEKLVDLMQADVNFQDRGGVTALHYACFKGHKQVVQKLIGAGARCDIKDVRGKTALDLTKSADISAVLDKTKA